VAIPDSSHGTNPASVRLAGYEALNIPSDVRGLVDVSALEKLIDEDVAGLMLTNPNTLGMFEEEIVRVTEAVHRVGGLVYYDGANLNAILGRCRPGDMGFDIVHINTHKTFATPHGGGGPGAGPVGVTEALVPYLPVPRVERDESGVFRLDTDAPESIGRMHGFLATSGCSCALMPTSSSTAATASRRSPSERCSTRTTSRSGSRARSRSRTPTAVRCTSSSRRRGR